MNEKKDYEKYRWFVTSSDKLVIGGKNSNQNEEIMKSVEADDVIMHTSAPGSPFCVVESPSKKDIEEAAIFTACFSHEWKAGKKKCEVHVFKGEQVIKKKSMKEGTFGIMGSVNKKVVQLKLALAFQKNKLRAVPLSATKKPLVIIEPGKLGKTETAEKIMKLIKDNYNYPITKEEILQAIPSDAMSVK